MPEQRPSAVFAADGFLRLCIPLRQTTYRRCLMNIHESVLSDATLLRRIINGDPAAATRLFEQHAPKLMGVARSRLSAILRSTVDPEDIVQSTFKSFFRRASAGGYAAPKAGDLFNLLIVIAMRKINAKADYHTASRRDVRKTRSTGDDILQDPHGNEPAVQELCLTIAELLEGFNETQRTIIALRLEGFTVQEIADRCQRSNRTVERELQAFRLRLSEEFAP